MLGKILLLIQTLKFLKWEQIVYQIKNKLFKPKKLEAYKDSNLAFFSLNFNEIPSVTEVLNFQNNTYTFTFLNLSHTFKDNILWNEQCHAKLWNYNLQYFDCLRQFDLDNQLKFELLRSIHQSLKIGELPLEPYPVSLRILNTIRFLSSLNASDVPNDIISDLKAQCVYLDKNLEYHILANHLLENCFAMFMAAQFFKNQKWRIKYSKLLEKQLNEQILNDGAHYELSPMYHQIILFRILEVLDYLSPKHSLYPLVYQQAQKMVNWIYTFSFTNGDFAHVNDSAKGIALSVNAILLLAKKHSILPQKTTLQQCGYRKLEGNNWEAIVDVGNILPSYQPGHAHADTFNFVVQAKNKNFIVDTGISTYNIGKTRRIERSTSAHNTLVVNHQNSSKVWSGFRVAKRAEVSILKDKTNHIIAQHNGYNHLKITHQRSFEWAENSLKIVDELRGDYQNKSIEGHIHFASEIDILQIDNNEIICNNGVKISFENCINIQIQKYNFCVGYNLHRTANKIVYQIYNNQSIINFHF